jgi:very-short-patch-repair endonuclease
MLGYRKHLKPFAQSLRKKLTQAEAFLWNRLRGKQILDCQFYRQKPLGNYIVDFYCAQARLVIEIDGGQHYSPEEICKDRTRDDYLAGQNLRVLRFSDREVLTNIDGVLYKIHSEIENRKI